MPNIRRELGLTSTGVQWVVNAYLIALAALFALGGRLSDISHATQTVLYVMCGIMAFVGVVALFGLQRGRQEVAPVDAESVGAPAG